MKYMPGFEEQLRQRRQLDLYELRKTEADTIVSGIDAGIAANIARPEAVNLRKDSADWLDSLAGFNLEALEVNELRDIRLMKNDVSEARARIVQYIQSLG